jgi:hypothetical protein
MRRQNLLCLVPLIASLTACYESGSVLDRQDAGRDEDAHVATDEDAGGDVDEDAGHDPDGGTPQAVECPAFDVRFHLCQDCEPSERAYWDGSRCVLHPNACGCEGADCGRLYESEAECQAAHASCPSSLCEATFGDWVDVGGSCPIRCGYEDDDTLSLCVGDPQCNCGAGRTFVDGVGCTADASCGLGDLCRATGGHPLTGDREDACSRHAVCGAIPGGCLETSMEASATACNCGPAMAFDPENGCVPDERCGTPWETEDAVCHFSGHVVGEPCMPSYCGFESPFFCEHPTCSCGEYEIFDPYRGCVWSPECRVRLRGTLCGEGGSCDDGLACCNGVCVTACDACDSDCDPITQCSTKPSET